MLSTTHDILRACIFRVSLKSNPHKQFHRFEDQGYHDSYRTNIHPRFHECSSGAVSICEACMCVKIENPSKPGRMRAFIGRAPASRTAEGGDTLIWASFSPSFQWMIGNYKIAPCRPLFVLCFLLFLLQIAGVRVFVLHAGGRFLLVQRMWA